MISRAGQHADDQRDLLPPGRGIHQLAGLQILQVIVGDGGGGEYHAVTSRAKATSAGAAAAGSDGSDSNTSSRAAPDHHQDADAGERAVRGADQACHVAADRGDEEAHQRHVENPADHQQRPWAPSPLCWLKAREQPRDRHQAAPASRCRPGRSGCPARCAAAGLVRPAQARGLRCRHAEPGHQTGLTSLQQGPHRRGANRPGADEAHLVAPDAWPTSAASPAAGCRR